MNVTPPLTKAPADTSPATAPPAANLAVGIAAGLVCGILTLVQSISLGTLLFAAVPGAALPVGIGMALVASAVTAALLPFLSNQQAGISAVQSVPTAAMAGAVADLAASSATDSPAIILATVVAASALTSVALGAGTFLLGRFHLSRYVRFLPLPVVGGFLAGSGWLLIDGGVEAIAGAKIGDLSSPLLADPALPWRVVAALSLLAAIAVLNLLKTARLALPLAVVTALILFNVIVWRDGISGSVLRAEHWLLDLGDHALWPPVASGDLRSVDWHAILIQTPHLATIVILAVISLLMNITGIELDSRREIDLDRELGATGIANILSGLAGGLIGYHSLSRTVLASRLGASNTTAGLVTAGVCLLALAFGRQVLAIVPIPLLGGVLVWMGVGLAYEWLVATFSRLSRPEYCVLASIFVVIVAVGFAWGVLFGLVAAAILFAIEYGRVEIVRYTLTGREYQTGLDASEERRELLNAHGDAILIIRLQGFLFFGTAERLRHHIRRRVAEPSDFPVRYLVIDFQRVSGIDSSAIMSFRRLAQSAVQGGFDLVLTGPSNPVQRALVRGGVLNEGDGVRIESNLERGLEWCENALLRDVAPNLPPTSSRSAQTMLGDVVRDPALAEALLPYFQPIHMHTGQRLITQGSPSDDIFLVEEGRAAVELSDGVSSVRLATVSRGAIVGEIAFYLGVPRSASITAETSLVAWRFSRADLERLSAAQPELAAKFHQAIAALLAERLTRTNRLVRLLAD